MNGPLDAENLTVELTEDGQIVHEPGYVGFLRSQGYIIDDIKESHSVKREGSETSHLVVEIQTYLFPRESEKLDLVEHQIDLIVCDCWAFRNESADVREPEITPAECGSCPHIKSVSKVEKAENDKNQTNLLSGEDG